MISANQWYYKSGLTGVVTVFTSALAFLANIFARGNTAWRGGVIANALVTFCG